MAAGVCVLLLLAVGLVFGQTLDHGFINFDDDEYVYENPHITHDSPAKVIVWAFTSTDVANWHPLTWISHILDYQLYGLQAGGHHFTNVLLHTITTVLLFLVLWRMTSNLWPSAFVAAVFGIHPLHVESVAWVAERKDVLSGLCFVLILWAYARYVERPASWGRYLTVVALFALGLMAKPMLVTVPFVLLLLDYWPLRRISGRSGADIPVCRKEPGDAGRQECLPLHVPLCLPHQAPLRRLIIEKIPLFVLACASCAVTFVAQSTAVQSVEFVPLAWRIANAMVSYVAYLCQSVWPVGLAVFYPHRTNNLPLWQVAVAAVVLLGISVAVLVWRRKCPYLLVGWLWYLGMLVPVIGLVQVGWQARADRYTYLTQIGLCIALAWGVARLADLWPKQRWVLFASSSLVIVILAGLASRQASYWHDSESLWGQALACTSNNAMAHYNLGAALEKRERIDDALFHYRQAVDIKPELAEAQNNLGVTLAKRGRFADAIVHYRAALKARPDYAEAHSNLAAALAKRGLIDEATDHFREAVRIKPDYAQAHYNLGIILARGGKLDEAIDHFQEALKINPDYAGARQMLEAVQAERENLPKSQH